MLRCYIPILPFSYIATLDDVLLYCTQKPFALSCIYEEVPTSNKAGHDELSLLEVGWGTWLGHDYLGLLGLAGVRI